MKTTALEGIRANKLRSFLTTLGIIIGIAAVIAAVAIGQGGRAVLMTEMEKIGTNIFAIYVDWRSGKESTGREFSLTDVPVLKDKVLGKVPDMIAPAVPPEAVPLSQTGSDFDVRRGEAQ